jgi:hypothetical protein
MKTGVIIGTEMIDISLKIAFCSYIATLPTWNKSWNACWSIYTYIKQERKDDNLESMET